MENQDTTRILLSEEQWEGFQEWLRRPAVANPKLVELLSKKSILEEQAGRENRD